MVAEFGGGDPLLLGAAAEDCGCGGVASRCFLDGVLRLDAEPVRLGRSPFTRAVAGTPSPPPPPPPALLVALGGRGT